MKYFRALLVVIALIISFSFTQAQDQGYDYAKQYTGAKLLFSQEKYNLAMEAFKPLIQTKEGNPYANYASFYYAMSAYREGYLPMAKNMLLQIKQQFPKWSRLSEVNLWLAHLYFESEEYNSGLNVLKSVEGKSFDRYIEKLKTYYFTGIASDQTLKDLYLNTKDAVAGKILAKRIAAQPLANRDQDLLDELIENLDLDAEQLNVSHVAKTIYKDKYKVAVLLPFMVQNLEPVDKPKVNQFVIDMYEGIKLATDSLKEKGVKIELFAYDTKRDSISTARILEKDELKGMDLIIGPLFSKQIDMVSEFGYRNQINVINPFYSNADLLGNNPFSFLYKPTDEVVGYRAAEFVAKHARNKVGIIFYGDTRQDSIMANAYKKRIEKDSFNIIINKKIEKDESRTILDLLLVSNKNIKEVSSEDAKEQLEIGLDSIGHIFVASNNDLISSKVVSAVETRGDSIMIVGSSDWLKLSSINYETYVRLGAALYAPTYLPKDTLGYDQFRHRYVLTHKKSPSDFVADGYELMMLMGNSLDKYGKYFQLGWNKEEFIPGTISYGYNYQFTNANHLVPILSFVGGEYKVILKSEEPGDDGDQKQ